MNNSLLTLINNCDTKCIEVALKFKEDLCLDINYKDKNGNTFLMIACLKGYEKIAKMLLENGADINIRNNKDEDAMHFVCLNNPKMIDLLVEHGAEHPLSGESLERNFPMMYLRKKM